MSFLKKTVCIIFLICLRTFCCAQNQPVDSLKKTLLLLKGTARIDCLNELAFEYSNPYFGRSHHIHTDTALLYVQQAQQESHKLNYVAGIARVYANLGFIAEQRGNFFLAEKYLLQAIPLFEKMQMKDDLIMARQGIGWCSYVQGRYKEALNIYQPLLEYYQTTGDSLHMAMIYRMAGSAYNKMGYSEKAFENFQKNNQIKKKRNDIFGALYTPEFKGDLYMITRDTLNALIHYKQSAENALTQPFRSNYYFLIMSKMFRLKHQYDSALYYLQMNVADSSTLNSDSFIKKSMLLLSDERLGELYLLLKDFDSALDRSWVPLKEYKSMGDVNQLMMVLNTIAKAYEGKKDNARAIYYGHELLRYAERSEARPLMRDGYRILWSAYEQQHNIELAYQYHLKYAALKESINGDSYRAIVAAWSVLTQMMATEEKYKAQIKMSEERNVAALESVNREKSAQLQLFAVVLGGLLLLAFVIVRNVTLKRKRGKLQFLMMEATTQLEKGKKEQQVAELEKEKTALEMQALRAQMNPHFIFNSLNSINRFILQNDRQKASEYLTKFSRLIRLILQNSQTSHISLESEIESLKLYLELEALRFDYRFHYKISYAPDLDISALKVPPLLIQPFAENAIWHGLMPKEEKGKLDIEISRDNDNLFFKITDDGIGRKQAATLTSKSTPLHKSMGLRITAERILLLKRTHSYMSSVTINDLVDDNGIAAGTEIIITVPAIYD